MNMIAQHDNATETRRQSIQAAIDATKSPSERNRLGQFATPNALAEDITRYIGTLIDPRGSGIRFADPSVGSGSFFSAALTIFGRKRIESAVGIELDPVFADAARDLWTDFGLQVIRGDFTHIIESTTRPSPPNVVLANPPYVRHHHMGREYKGRLKDLTSRMAGVEVNGLAGLYVYFLLLTTAWMEAGGHAAWLIPSEFMDVNYGVALKRFLTDRVTLIRVHRFDPEDVQFGDALVSSAVVVFKKCPPMVEHRAEFTFGGTLEAPHACESLALDRLRASHKWTIYPNHSKNDRHTISDGTGLVLSDLFRIQRGIATGDNKFFILSRDEAKSYELSEEYLRPILPSPRYLKDVIIEGDADGYPILDRQLCVIDCALPEHAVEQRYPALWKYLQTAEELGVKNGYLVSKRSPWYRQERREPCKFLCTYMGRGSDDKQPFRFIYNRSRAIGTNLYLMLYPQNKLATILQKHPNLASDVHQLLGYVTGHELRGEGRVYGGGLNKIEPSELGRVSAASFVERWPELAASVRRGEGAGLFD